MMAVKYWDMEGEERGSQPSLPDDRKAFQVLGRLSLLASLLMESGG